MANRSQASLLAHAEQSDAPRVGTVASVTAECYRLPLSEPLVDAAHGEHHFFELVLCKVRTSNGQEGVGYTYTGGSGGRAIAEFIRTDLAPIVTGSIASDIETSWHKLQSQLHYVGRGGLLSFAIAALDIALWDIAAKASSKSIAHLISQGAPAREIEAYAGFIDLNKDGDGLARLAEDALGRGFNAIKTKVGRPEIAEDVERVGLLRSVIGTDRKLMIDANFSLEVESAIALSKAVEEFDIGWFEEPISPDNFEGYAAIADATNIPLAMGENLHIIEEFERAIRYSRLAILQPDASNIGGITGWLKAAKLAKDAGIAVCTHGMHELHVSLLAAIDEPGCLEYHSFPIDHFTKHPLEIENGFAKVPDRPGIGVEFDDSLLRSHRVS